MHRHGAIAIQMLLTEVISTKDQHQHGGVFHMGQPLVCDAEMAASAEGKGPGAKGKQRVEDEYRR